MAAPFRASAPALGALRLPIYSKSGNKNFYKGTGAKNVLMRQRITRTTRRGRVLLNQKGMPDEWSWKMNQIDESRTTAFVVPPGLGECKLRPFVFTGTAKEGGLPQKSQTGYLDSTWAYPDHKGEDATDVSHPRLVELDGIPAFENGRFNPRFYTALGETIRERRALRTQDAAAPDEKKGVFSRFGLGRK